MIRALCFILALSVGAGWSRPSLAWGDEGHEIVALVASHFLTPDVRKQVKAMLRDDPDPLTGHTIEAAATWADKYRDSNQDGARQRTRLWHFVDIELSAPDLDHACFGHPPIPADTAASKGPEKDCVVDKIDQFAAELANPSLNPAERIVALKFLLHFVGDLHQPLHASDDHDRGGNDKRASSDDSYAGTLHHYWDTEFVAGLGEDAHRVASMLVHRISADDRKLWSRGTASDWALESFQLAKADVYGQLPPPNPKGGYRLSEAYTQMAVRDAGVQLSKAGVRLAAVLNKALGGAR